LLVILLFLYVFDSQDLFFGIKTPVFAVIILLSLIYGVYNRKKISECESILTISNALADLFIDIFVNDNSLNHCTMKIIPTIGD